MNNILLTGGTGVVGSAVLSELVKDPDNVIYLLARAENEKNLIERLQGIYQFYGLDRNNPNLVPVAGDISKLDLGMSKEQHDRLIKKINIVIHSAANVKMNQSIEQARLNALTGTHSVFEFAQRCENIQRVTYISTLGVNGKSKSILQEVSPPQNIEYHNTYEQAKAEAEFYIFDKLYDALPVIIIRPSMVVGNSNTGAMFSRQIFYFLCQYLLKGDGLGFLPRLDSFFLDTIPVDYLGEFTAHISTDKSIKNAIFNACAGYRESTSLLDIRNLLLSLCESKERDVKRITMLPLPFYQRLIEFISFFLSKKSKSEIKQLSFFLEYLKNSPRFANERYVEQCQSFRMDIRSPKEYLPAILKNCV